MTDSNPEVSFLRQRIKEMKRVVSDPDSFELTGKISGIDLPLNQPVEIVEGFTAINRLTTSTYSIIEVHFKKGKYIPSNFHLSKETIHILKGILETTLWDVNGQKQQITVDEHGRLHTVTIGTNQPHAHTGIEDGIWVSILHPPITKQTA